MATEKPKVLDRDYGISNLITPTGRSIGTKRSTLNPALLQVCYTDGKPGGMLPEELDGLFTKQALAEDAIRRYVTRFWDTSDKAASK